MSVVKNRMLEIVDSLPENYFDNLGYTQMVIKLTLEYMKRYGKDETTRIPGTDEYFTVEKIKEWVAKENKNEKEGKENS